MNRKGPRRIELWPYRVTILAVAWRDAVKQSQDSKYHGGDLNRAPLEYKSTALRLNKPSSVA
jgi:hypothetical protein